VILSDCCIIESAQCVWDKTVQYLVDKHEGLTKQDFGELCKITVNGLLEVMSGMERNYFAMRMARMAAGTATTVTHYQPPPQEIEAKREEKRVDRVDLEALVPRRWMPIVFDRDGKPIRRHCIICGGGNLRVDCRPEEIRNHFYGRGARRPCLGPTTGDLVALEYDAEVQEDRVRRIAKKKRTIVESAGEISTEGREEEAGGRKRSGSYMPDIRPGPGKKPRVELFSGFSDDGDPFPRSQPLYSDRVDGSGPLDSTLGSSSYFDYC